MCVRIAGRIAALIFVALTTANCATPVATVAKSGNKYGVAASPKVIPDGQPIPKGGGRDMVGKPYVVGERTYVPHDGKGYAREGEASWYGTAFHGRLTANGEVFDKESIAAAHPTLPLPSYVRVTNLANRRSMVVRVNDRGPYERGRLIDLSERAADALQFRRAGTTKVRVEYVGRASVKGSDDRKLLATLQTDGAPAGGGSSRGPVMLASLDEGGARPTPLAFKPADTRPLPRVRELEEAERAAPAKRIPPVVVASRDLGPAPRLQQPGRGDRITDAHGPARLARALPIEAPQLAKPHPTRMAERAMVRPDRSLDLATIPGAANPTPPAHKPQIAMAGAKSLPPERPILAGLYYADVRGKGAVKDTTTKEPSAKLARQRVVSLKPNGDSSLR